MISQCRGPCLYLQGPVNAVFGNLLDGHVVLHQAYQQPCSKTIQSRAPLHQRPLILSAGSL